MVMMKYDGHMLQLIYFYQGLRPSNLPGFTPMIDFMYHAHPRYVSLSAQPHKGIKAQSFKNVK